MANNRELADFGSYVVVNNNTVSIASTGTLTAQGLSVSGISTFNDTVRIGTGITMYSSSGIVSATSYFASGARRVVAFDVGTTSLFQQTTAPTGWTKQTTHNDKALRVVSGSASSGGSTAFTSVFASRTPAGSVSGTNTGGSVTGSNSGGSVANTTVTGSVSGSNSGGSVSNTTITTTTMPSHRHFVTAQGATSPPANEWFADWANFAGVMPSGSPQAFTWTAGSDGAHSHGFTNPTWSGSISMNAHNHTFTNPTWTQGTFTNPTWSGTFTGSSMDFAVQYVDIILCSID